MLKTAPFSGHQLFPLKCGLDMDVFLCEIQIR